MNLNRKKLSSLSKAEMKKIKGGDEECYVQCARHSDSFRECYARCYAQQTT